MRYAVISDIHGNLESLQAALAQVAEDDVVLCLGDVVGYGPNPNECVELISQRAQSTVLGNHDIAAIENFGVEYFNPAARAAIEWTQGVISQKSRDWMNELGYEIRTPEYLLVHGAPKNYFEYILDKGAAKRAFRNTDAPIIFVGHTHIADYYKLDDAGSISHAHMQNGGEITLDEGARYIINAGSIGQPRDLNPQPSMVFYDPSSRAVSFRRYDYPISAVQAKMHAADLPQALAARLQAGR